jgi:hypothetical protein
MAPQPNLFDGRLALIFWTARSVSENTVADLASNVRAAAPNVNAVCFKTSNGTSWQSVYDTTKPDLMVGSMADVRRWSDTLAAHGLEPHAWCVLRGQSPEQEADRIAEICLRGGVRSMLLDLETGPSYFVGDRNAAQTLAVGLRQRVGADFHLGLIFDARGTYPQRLWVQDIWFPEIDSLHPMVYPYHFGISAAAAFRSLQAAIGRWGKPIYPMIEGYSPDGYPPYPAADIPATAAVTVNTYHTTGLSIFRYGKGLDIYDGVGRGDLGEVAKITLYEGAPVIVVTPPPVPPSDSSPADGATLVMVDPSNESTGEFTIGYYGDPDVISPGWAVDLDINGHPYAYRPASYNTQTLYVTYLPRLASPGNYIIEVFIPRQHAYVPDAHYVVVEHPGGVRREVTVVLNQAAYQDAWVPLQGDVIDGVPGGPLVTQFALDPAQPESGRVNLADVTFVDPAARGKFEITFGAIRWRPA